MPDILDMVDDSGSGISDAAKNFGSKKGKFKKQSKSIIKAAKGNIFEFPVFVANSVPLDYATATVSLLEQVYASYLQMAISINPVIDSDMAKKGAQFDHLRSDTNRYLECVDPTEMPYAYDACHAVYNEEGVITEFNLVNIEDKTAQIINEAVDHQPLSEFNHFFQEEVIQEAHTGRTAYERTELIINGKHTGVYYKTTTAQEIPRNGNATQEQRQAEAVRRTAEARRQAIDEYMDSDKFKKDQEKFDDWKSKVSDEKEKLSADVDKAKEDAKAAKNKRKWDEEDREDNKERIKLTNEKTKKEIEKFERDAAKDKENEKLDKMKKLNDARMKTPQFLDESKIQKLNTMKPLMMSVDLNVVDSKGTLSAPVSYVVGVKCHTRLIESSILPEVAAYPLKEMNEQTRKIRWRAGELKFGRDIKWKKLEKKQTAVDSRDPKRKWYRRLYELSHMSGDGTAAASVKNGKSPWANWWKDKFTGGNNKDVGYGLIPNATIVMSKADVDNIKREKGIDLLSGGKANKFCKELFLIGLVVIDNDAESVKVMFPDLHGDYEVHSIAAINKQLAQLDTAGSKTRDIMKLLG